jgi:hypothetical protein
MVHRRVRAALLVTLKMASSEVVRQKAVENALFNVKGDVVKRGPSLGSGNTIGKVGDYSIKGMERELGADIVAAYHFLVKKIV